MLLHFTAPVFNAFKTKPYPFTRQRFVFFPALFRIGLQKYNIYPFFLPENNILAKK